MENEAAARHGGVESAGIEEVRPEEGQPAGAILRDRVQVVGLAGVVRVADSRVDVEAAFEEPLDQP